jgi:hypothetical protein
VVLVAAAIGIAYVVIDPLAPNWEIRETKLSDTRFRIDMRKKRITTGGDGESIDLFHRQAEQIAAQLESPGYTIMSWNEGVESDFLIARRWSRGVIEVVALAKVGQQSTTDATERRVPPPVQTPASAPTPESPPAPGSSRDPNLFPERMQ